MKGKLISQEGAALTFGAFAMCEAAQMLLAYQVGTTPKDMPKYFRNESKMHLQSFMNHIESACRELKMFNENVADMYAGLGGCLKHDEVRRVGNDIIRYYCDFRNYVETPEDATKFDAILFNMSSGKTRTISPEVRNSFRLR